MEVQHLATWVPFSDEMIVDFGIGTELQRFDAAVRLMRRGWQSDRAWRALPFHLRLWRTVSRYLR